MLNRANNLQAIILAGGEGTRLRPYTTVLPKPLMPVGNYPILEIVIRQLKRHGFRHIVLSIGYHYEIFRAFFQDGKKWGVQIEYSIEEQPLGTAGPLRLVKNLEDNFLVMNGDTLTDLNYSELYNTHLREGSNMTIATKNRAVKIDYGVIRCDQNMELLSYTEKPELEYTVGMGVTIFSKRLLELIPVGERYDMPNLVNEMIRRGIPIRCFPFDGYWLDIGRYDDYKIAIEEFSENKKRFLGVEDDIQDTIV